MSNLITSDSPFDSIRHFDSDGSEFWYARELMPLLQYKLWQRFNEVIEVAIENLETVVSSSVEHRLSLEIKTKGRPKLDYKLSRLACYHIALCCDSRGNDAVKMAKHYFANKLIFADYMIWKQTGNVPDIFGNACSREQSTDGFIYLLSQSATPYYKIGKSKNPYKRAQSLQTGTPLELIIIERYYSLDCGQLEKLLHKYYDAYRVRGEWFDFLPGIIDEFLSVARMLDDVVEDMPLLPETTTIIVNKS